MSDSNILRYASKFDRKTFDSAFKFIADQLNLSPADENDVAWKVICDGTRELGRVQGYSGHAIDTRFSCCRVMIKKVLCTASERLR